MTRLLALVAPLLLAVVAALPAARSQTQTPPKSSPMIAPVLSRNEVYHPIFRSPRPATTVGGFKLAPAKPVAYVCTATSCSCSGSYDCVKMIAADQKCDNTTVGCNDAGCVCTPK